jgi:hypothetical protein
MESSERGLLLFSLKDIFASRFSSGGQIFENLFGFWVDLRLIYIDKLTNLWYVSPDEEDTL